MNFIVKNTKNNYQDLFWSEGRFWAKLWALCILFVGIQAFSFNAYSQKSKFSLTVDQKSIEEALGEIEKKTEFYFTYNPKEINSLQKVTLKLVDADISTAVEQIFPKGNIGYTINGKHVVLFEKNKQKLNTSDPQKRKVTGVVKEKSGEPLIGVSVKVKDLSMGAITDIDGRFEVEVYSEKDILIISYVGYTSKQIVVGTKSHFDVILEEDIEQLDEVVVVGYATQRRVNLTGAVQTISSEVLESRPVSNPVSALQGEIPGMTIQRESGQPGNEKFKMNVRGQSSTEGGNAPLIIIDGVAGDMNLLNPGDIESITVLKDAQAAIYGARAAGGVVLVTTKKGKQGAPRIQYSGNFAITKPAGMMKNPTTYQMALMDNEANMHNGAAPLYTEDYLDRIRRNDPNPIDHPLYGGWKLFFTSTDWLGELLENGSQQKHNVTISGGGEQSSYFLSAGFADLKGVVRYAKDNNKKYNLRLNYDYQLFKWLKLETKTSYEDQKRTDLGGIHDWIIGEAIFDMPNHPIYNSEGNFFAQGGWSNAIAIAKHGETGTFNTTNLNTNIKFIFDITKDFKFNLQAGLNRVFYKEKDPYNVIPLYNWNNEITYYATANIGEASLKESSRESLYQNYTGYFQYDKMWKEAHNLTLMGGSSFEKEEFDLFGASRVGFDYPGLWSMDLGSKENMDNWGRGEHWAIASLFGRLGYAFKSKYLFETNWRYDGSSRFSGADKRWGLFPGFSVGWRISEEGFMKSLTWLDDLKLRASYGETGNQEGIRLYDYIQKLQIGKDRNDKNKEVVYPFGPGSKTPTAWLDGIVSPSRTWETIINQNVGVDAVLLNQKLNVSFDYFVKRNKNMLIPIAYPSMLGDKAPTTNSGELKTWGWEVSAMWKDKVGAVDYYIKLSASDAQNKLVDYGGQDTYTLGLNNFREGYPINSYFAYEFDGLIRNQSELDAYKKLEGVPSNIGIGDARFKDRNEDGKISIYGDGDDGDVKYVGSLTPRLNFGATLGGKYKNFDISLFFQGVGRRTIFREGDYRMPWSDWWRQPPAFYFEQTWSQDRPDAYYPRLSHGDIRHWNYEFSTLQEIDAKYIRLKNLQVGYTFPASLIQKIALSRARIYFSGQDLWEAHGIKGGWDPESVNWGGNYPFQRYYSFGLDVTF